MCKGIELLDNLAELGKKVTGDIQRLCTQEKVTYAPITVIKGDILTEDWSDADIIFAASVCFSNELLEAFSDKC